MSAPTPPIARPRRRRRAWPWVLLGVLALLVAAAVAADALARSFAEKAIAQELVSALHAPADTAIEVRLGGGSVLLQALSGDLDLVEAEVTQLALGPLTGDLSIVAKGVPLDPSAPTREFRVRYVIPERALSALTPEIAGATIDDVALEGTELVARGTLTVLGMSAELGLGLTPSAVDGELVFEPASVRLGDRTLSVEELRSEPFLGGLAEALLAPRRVCIADALPAALTLTALRVEGASLVAELDGSGAALGSPAFRSRGVCAG